MNLQSILTWADEYHPGHTFVLKNGETLTARQIAEKFRRYEEDMQSIVNICAGREGFTAKIANFARESIAFDPLQ